MKKWLNRDLKQIWFLPRYGMIGLVKIYQKTLSPDHGFLKVLFPYGCCRFQPTCSEYAVQALKKYGLVRGSIKSIWRVLRCNPCSRGGKDPVR